MIHHPRPRGRNNVFIYRRPIGAKRWRLAHAGHNTITAVGVTGIRDRLAGDTQVLGADTVMVRDTVEIGGMDTGFPQLNAANELLFQTTITHTAADVNITNLYLRAITGGAAWAALTGTAFAPELTEFEQNTQYLIQWVVAPSVSYRAGGQERAALLQLSGLTEANQARSLSERVAGLGGDAALTARLILIGIDPNVSQGDLDRFDIADPDPANLVVLDTISPIALAIGSGTNDFLIGPYTFPAVTGAGVHLLRWYALAINQGNILLDLGAVTAGGIQQFPARADPTPNVTQRVVIG